jgi:hypothetical protein
MNKRNMSGKINFKITNYTKSEEAGFKKIVLNGHKLPPPSKRITLNQTGIKILDAKIIHHHKKGDIEFEIIRLNRVKTFGETRLHTSVIMYPGSYTVILEYSGDLNEEALKNQAE